MNPLFPARLLLFALLILTSCTFRRPQAPPAPSPLACKGGAVFMDEEATLEVTLWRCSQVEGQLSWLRGELTAVDPGYQQIVNQVRGLKPAKAVELKAPLPPAVVDAAGRRAVPFRSFSDMPRKLRGLGS